MRRPAAGRGNRQPPPVTTERYRRGAVLQPHELLRLLRRQLRYGLRASRLLDCPKLIDHLCPEQDDPSRTLFDRALVAEAKIAQAVDPV